MIDKTFLDKAYDIEGPDGIRKLYAEWAQSYEAEVKANGYATPDRVAEALVKVNTPGQSRVLDYGCGTGLSGVALASVGFANVTGADPSAEMLAIAGAKDVYRDLTELDISQPPPFEKASFDVIAAIGVIGAGAAPASVFDDLFALLAPGQRFALSFNDHTMSVPEFPEKIESVVAAKSATVLFQEMGDHLPGQNMKSVVYILEKT